NPTEQNPISMQLGSYWITTIEQWTKYCTLSTGPPRVISGPTKSGRWRNYASSSTLYSFSPQMIVIRSSSQTLRTLMIPRPGIRQPPGCNKENPCLKTPQTSQQNNALSEDAYSPLTQSHLPPKRLTHKTLLTPATNTCMS